MINETTIFSEWLDQKYREGKSEGVNMGRLEEARALLRKQLRIKFGDLQLDFNLKQALEDLDLEQLDSLAGAFFDFQSVADFKAWLVKNEKALAQEQD